MRIGSQHTHQTRGWQASKRTGRNDLAAAGQGIVTVCRSRARAHTAAQIHRTGGYARVSVLNDGMIAWNTSRWR